MITLTEYNRSFELYLAGFNAGVINAAAYEAALSELCKQLAGGK
jgi:hypothetical protein